MTAAMQLRGAAPVAMLEAVPASEALLIGYLRDWCDGPEGQVRVWNAMAEALGTDAARSCLAALEELCALIARHGRRPLMRHRPACRCVGSDEAVFANFVATAAMDAREDAMLIATLLLRADMLPAAVRLAQAVGLGVMRIVLRREESVPAPTHRSDTRH